MWIELQNAVETRCKHANDTGIWNSEFKLDAVKIRSDPSDHLFKRSFLETFDT